MAKKDSYLKGGIIGAAIGVVAGLLFAPKSGKETREDIKQAANKTAKELESKLKELHDQLADKAEETKAAAKKLKGTAKTELGDLSKRAEAAKAQLGELLSAIREGGSDDTITQKAIDEATELLTKIKKGLEKK